MIKTGIEKGNREFYRLREQMLGKIIENVSIHFLIRKVSNMFVAKVVEVLAANPEFANVDEKELANLLYFVVETLPEWASLVENRIGQILKVNKELSTAEMIETLRKRLREEQ